MPVRAGAALPSAAGNSDFSAESVAISGQAGAVSPLAGVDVDRIRDAMETFRQQNPGSVCARRARRAGGSAGQRRRDGDSRRGPRRAASKAGWAGLVAADLAAGGRGGFGNFRGFNPGQPHGAIFWMGSNSALNAEPFSLRGQPQEQPASGNESLWADVHQRAVHPGC